MPNKRFIFKSYSCVTVLVLACLFISQSLFSFIDVHFQPGADFYGDGSGLSAKVGMRTDIRSMVRGFPAGFFIGADVLLSGAQTPLSNLNMFAIGAAAVFGYDVFSGIFGRTDGFGLSPYCIAGVGFTKLENQYTNVFRAGLLLSPGLRIDVPVGDRFQVGLDAGYRMLFMDLLTDSFVLQTPFVSLSFTIRFGSGGTQSGKSAGNDHAITGKKKDDTAKPIPVTNNSPVKSELKKYSPAEMQKMDIAEIVKDAKKAYAEKDMEYTKVLVKEGLLKEPDNPELLRLFSELIKDKSISLIRR